MQTRVINDNFQGVDWMHTDRGRPVWSSKIVLLLRNYVVVSRNHCHSVSQQLYISLPLQLKRICLSHVGASLVDPIVPSLMILTLQCLTIWGNVTRLAFTCYQVCNIGHEPGQDIAGIGTSVGNIYWVYYISTRLHPRKLRHALLFALAGWFSADFFFLFFLSFNLVERKESSCCTIDQEKKTGLPIVCVYIFSFPLFLAGNSVWHRSELSDVPFCPEFLT